MEIKNDNGIPIYHQLADYLRNQIEDGTTAPGDPVPSENTLCAQYNISRVTVRKSLQLLTDEGLLVKRQGKGTFVATTNFIESSRASGSFTLSCIQSGVTPSTKVILCSTRYCNAELALDLGISQGDEIIIIKRVRYANDVPVIFETDYIPKENHEYLLEMDLNEESLLDLMRTKGNAVFGGYDDIIDLFAANDEKSTWLKVKKKTPLLRVYQKVFDNRNNIMYVNEQIINSERYKYVSVHKR
jgi:GntR family transcriptional regulator